ncbi:unnamed protein product [Brassica oleracea]
MHRNLRPPLLICLLVFTPLLCCYIASDPLPFKLFGIIIGLLRCSLSDEAL